MVRYLQATNRLNLLAYIATSKQARLHLLQVHFDSHSDVWDSYFGRKYNHGTPFRRAMEEGLLIPNKSIQIGMRGPLYSARVSGRG